jgi:hypothetical protein
MLVDIVQNPYFAGHVNLDLTTNLADRLHLNSFDIELRHHQIQQLQRPNFFDFDVDKKLRWHALNSAREPPRFHLDINVNISKTSK